MDGDRVVKVGPGAYRDGDELHIYAPELLDDLGIPDTPENRRLVEWAWKKWPPQRLYTTVNPRKIKSTNPGFCFLCAGWRRCGFTESGLIILEKEAAC